jgi:putative Holliday junction resolvase
MVGGCVVGIDPGERWIGVAKAASGSSLALPVGTLDRRGGDRDVADALKALLDHEDISELVVGVPLRPDGREDEQAASFRRFGEALASSLGAVCIAQDERFSSELATPVELSLGSAGGRKSRASGRKSVQRQRRERERSHASAAARILQRWLDTRDGERARNLVDREV